MGLITQTWSYMGQGTTLTKLNYCNWCALSRSEMCKLLILECAGPPSAAKNCYGYAEDAAWLTVSVVELNRFKYSALGIK